jgi:hypothetical protein
MGSQPPPGRRQGGQPQGPRYGGQPQGPRYGGPSPASREWYGGPPHNVPDPRRRGGSAPRPRGMPTGTVPWWEQGSGWDGFVTGGGGRPRRGGISYGGRSRRGGTGYGGQPAPSGAEIARAVVAMVWRTLGGR